jgi:hypothetical protein
MSKPRPGERSPFHSGNEIVEQQYYYYHYLSMLTPTPTSSYPYNGQSPLASDKMVLLVLALA